MSKGENIYKRKDGRWEGRYPKARKADGSIHYGYIYAQSYRLVKERMIEKKAQEMFLHRGPHRDFKGSFGDWSYIWLTEIMQSKIKESTYAGYNNKFQVHLLPILGHRPLKKITILEIDQLVKKLSSRLKASSVHIIFRLLKNCFEEARRQGYLHINPCAHTQLPKVDKARVRALTREEQRALEKEIQASVKGLPILIALETGMRIGEICALRWHDIDFEKSLLKINHSKQRIALPSESGKRTKIIETRPKTANGERIIPLTKKIKEALLEEQKKAISSYVITEKGRGVEPRTISYRFERIKKSLGLPDVPFHALRHTFATRCVELGVNIAAISGLLGHSSIKLTLDTYTTSFFAEQKKAIEKLASL